MAKKSSYLVIAMNDYRYYMASIKSDFYFNGTIIQGQQFIEKALKAILEFYNHDKDDDVFKTHNIRKLVNTVAEYVSDINMNDIELSNGYYFEVRYPGDNYFEPKEHDFDKMNKAVEATVELLKDELSKHDPLMAALYKTIW